MKPVLSISAAMLLAMSLTACGNNDSGNADDQNTNAGSESAQTNTATSGDESASESGMSGESDSGMSQSSSSNGGNGMGSGDNTADEDMPKAAVAVLHGTQGNDGVSATIRFTPKDGGLAYTTQAEGLKPGKHGYHIHLYGDCSSSDGKSAGTHFNLKGSSENPPKDIDRITGDLGELDAGEDGSAQDQGMLAGASLTGAKALIGRGVIIHAKPNDPSQPPIGAAGGRQACGVIGIAEPQSGASAGGGSSMSSGSGSESGSGSADSESSSSSM